MIKRESEMPVYIDVDETLITNFTTEASGGNIELMYYGKNVRAFAIEKHVDLVIAYKQRGYEVTVWSANGWEWAEQVVRKLGLIDFVDYVATKPRVYVDDKPIEHWAHRVYIS